MSRALPLVAVCLLLSVTAHAGTVVAFNTSFGPVTAELYNDVAPSTCSNFLDYIYAGRYAESMYHRSADLTDGLGNYLGEFILQSGGFALIDGEWDAIPAYPPVVNEYSISNTRGTIAMAKLDGDPDSATNQFFFNLGDNSGNLDNQNDGFTVFGLVTSGMDIIDYIASLPTYDLRGYSAWATEPWAGAMGEVPLYDDGTSLYFIQNISIEVPATVAGDATYDGNVDIFDLAALANNYGLPGDKSRSMGDFNGDGTVNVHDLAILANNYGTTTGGSAGLTTGGAPVPEPATLLALALAAPFALRLRRRPVK